MAWPSPYQLVESSKVVIATIVMTYAYFFMRQSQESDERRPWEYLYIGGMFLFIAELIVALRIARPLSFSDPFFTSLESLMGFSFLGFFLFSFISQHHLLVKRHIIFIQRSPDKTWFDRLRESWRRRRREGSQRREEAAFQRKLEQGVVRRSPSSSVVPRAAERGTPELSPDAEPEEAPEAEQGPGPKPAPKGVPKSAPRTEQKAGPPAEPATAFELPRLDDEPEAAPKVAANAAKPGLEAEALLKQGAQLAAQVEELLSRYHGRVDPARAARMQEQLSALKALLAERPLRQAELKRQIGLLLGKH